MAFVWGLARFGEVHMFKSRMAAGAATFVLTLVTGLSAHAEPACWHPYEVEAAQVRDLQTLLMMGTLKCGSAGSRSEEHTSELQSLMRISYAVFCLKKKKKTQRNKNTLNTI